MSPEGYPRYANDIPSDAAFCFFRRFDRLNTRIILRMQSNLSRTEKTLDRLDAHYMRRGSDVIDNGTFCLNGDDERLPVLSCAQTQLKEYSTSPMPFLFLFISFGVMMISHI